MAIVYRSIFLQGALINPRSLSNEKIFKAILPAHERLSRVENLYSISRAELLTRFALSFVEEKSHSIVVGTRTNDSLSDLVSVLDGDHRRNRMIRDSILAEIEPAEGGLADPRTW